MPDAERLAHLEHTWQVASGVHRERLEVEGRGDQQSVGDNSTAEGRARNRRVDILLVDGQA